MIITDQTYRFKIAGKLVPISIKELSKTQLALKFKWSSEPYFDKLLDELKAMGGRWNPDKRLWTVPNNSRTLWTIRYLTGDDPYKRYDQPLIDCNFDRPVYNHQKDITKHILTYRQIIIAAEMRTGKTLATMIAMERSQIPIDEDHMLWVGPRSALAGVQLEFRKWGLRGRPRLLTYEGMKKAVEIWPAGKPAPRFVIFDEAQRIKTPASQRSVAAKYIADQMREEYGDEAYVVLLTGTPAPKSPADWFWLCEVACPGFIREGNIHKFKSRLACIIQKESPSGGVYPEIVSWFDDPNKCKVCGQTKEAGDHDVFSKYAFHKFEPSKNEIAFLYERMRGLVLVKFKKDCLDLPAKQYQIIECKPTREMENAAKIIQAKAKRVISAMILSRELSDGFQYKEIESGTTTCTLCHGSGKIDPELIPQIKDETTEEPSLELDFNFDDIEILEDGVCPLCKGKRIIPRYIRETVEIETPKTQVIEDLLDQHEEVGRIVLFAGFQGSVDRLVKLCIKNKWEWIKVDGRGWYSSLPLRTDQDKLYAFANQQDDYPKIAYIGHPASGGVGNDLSASPTICYYSNDFIGENRMQSEDRIHSPAMNVNLGATIIDLICLPTDRYILDNLKEKRRLQDITLGEMHNSIKYYTGERQT